MVKQSKTQRWSWTVWEGWEQLESDHSAASRVTCSAEAKKSWINWTTTDSTHSMARLTGQVELGSKIKVAPWLRLQETAKQKTSLNKHRGRYLASTEGGLESNRQGMVPELLEDGYIRGILVLVHRAHQLKWCNSTQKQNKCEQICFAPKFLCAFNLFWFFQTSKTKQANKKRR